MVSTIDVSSGANSIMLCR